MNEKSEHDICYVPIGEDREAEHRSLGVSTVAFKIVAQDNPDVFIIENIFHAKGGPARHLHYHQDEWFYALEGEFVIEIGNIRFKMKPGDSLYAPRNVPHVWAHTGASHGRMLIVFTPAGKMEAFFRQVTKANSMPPQDPELWRYHDMELLGPPLDVA